MDPVSVIMECRHQQCSYLRQHHGHDQGHLVVGPLCMYLEKSNNGHGYNHAPLQFPRHSHNGYIRRKVFRGRANQHGDHNIICLAKTSPANKESDAFSFMSESSDCNSRYSSCRTRNKNENSGRGSCPSSQCISKKYRYTTHDSSSERHESTGSVDLNVTKHRKTFIFDYFYNQLYTTRSSMNSSVNTNSNNLIQCSRNESIMEQKRPSEWSWSGETWMSDVNHTKPHSTTQWKSFPSNFDFSSNMKLPMTYSSADDNTAGRNSVGGQFVEHSGNCRRTDKEDGGGGGGDFKKMKRRSKILLGYFKVYM